MSPLAVECHGTRANSMFNLAINSKLRACDLTRLQVQDVRHGSHVAVRTTVMQQKTQRSVQFETTSPHLSTRQYARIVHRWVASIGLDDTAYATHTMRRTKASLIYRRTKNLRAVQLLLGHTKLESTVRYLGIKFDDALEMAEQTEVRCTLAGERPLAGQSSR
ncbi:phage integrase family protein [Pigmentiphaga kullae]|uniref:Phage integrase family protein n=1 Tax=Pigmentiphaga kullae TaxID=151784 RepID=A0A4Q7NMW8_9BURK|nr:phage integrase family protein [Pigmentiphaga kullae]